jgi:hypothetical protein
MVGYFLYDHHLPKMSDYYPKPDYQELLYLRGDSIGNVQQGYWPADTIMYVVSGDLWAYFTNGYTCYSNSAGDARNPFDPVDLDAKNAGIPGPYPTAARSFGRYPSKSSSSGPYPRRPTFFSPQPSKFGSFSHSMASNSTNSDIFLSGGQNPSTSIVATPPVDLSLSGQQIPIVDYGLYNEYDISMSPQAPPSFIYTATWAQVPNSGAHSEGSGTYFSSIINQSPTSLDSDPLLDPGDVSMHGPQEAVMGMCAQQIHWPADMIV